LMMVRAGSAVDDTIKALLPYLEKADILIDGGNSNYEDTNKRMVDLDSKGYRFFGMGVSGGEEGALRGPSIMPGGSRDAWEEIKPIFQSIAATVEDGTPCCDYVGEAGSGHFVKMVHNGIEYGDMQLISEGYLLMKEYLKMTNDEISQCFDDWNKGDLDSYLIEITRDIMRKKDETGAYVVDYILDKAGQKGTGKWTVMNGLELASPVTLIAEAVFARVLSASKNDRIEASKILSGPDVQFNGNRQEFLNDLRDSIFASKMISYAQGYLLLKQAAEQFKWDLNYGAISLMWRGGCIIRSKFLGKIKEAFEKNKQLKNLILDDHFKEKITIAQPGWRRVAAAAMIAGYPIPAISTALSYFDGMRRANLPHNLLQAQRDFFGAHTYERTDKPQGEFFHTNWTGQGGSTSSTTYSV